MKAATANWSSSARNVKKISSSWRSSNGYATRILNILDFDISPGLLILSRALRVLAPCSISVRYQVLSCNALQGNFSSPWIMHIAPGWFIPVSNRTLSLLFTACWEPFPDIKPQNIMVRIPDFSVIDEYLKERPADPAAYDPTSGSWKIVSQPLRDFYIQKSTDLETLDVILCDWGSASWVDKHLTEPIQPYCFVHQRSSLEAHGDLRLTSGTWAPCYSRF